MFAAWLFFNDRFKDVFFPDTANWNVTINLLQTESGWPVDIAMRFRSLEGKVYITLPKDFAWDDDSASAERLIAPEEMLPLKSPYGSGMTVILARMDRESLSFTKYRVSNGVITIGRMTQNAICDHDGNISGDHGYFDLRSDGHGEYTDHSANGTFLNGRRIKATTVHIHFGDTLTWPSGLKMIYLNSILAINHISSLEHVRLELASPSAVSRQQEPSSLPSLYVEYHRAPRMLQKPELEDIEIEPPIAKQNQQQQPMWLQIGPSMTMVLPMAVSTLVMMSANQGRSPIPSGLIMIGTSSMLAVMWGIVNRRHRDRQAAETEAHRIGLYRKYIEEMETTLSELNAHEYDRLTTNFPNVGECVELPTDGTNRLWNRMPTHPDFLHVRLGIGSVPLPTEIKIQKQKLSIIDDPLRSEPERLKDTYSVVNDAPVTVNLRRESVVGILGADDATMFAQGLLMQIAAMHSYHDVRVAVLTDPFTHSAWSWARWLPHVFASEDRETRMVGSSHSAIHDIMSILSDVLNMRRSSQEEQDGNKPDKEEELEETALPLPHYIIFCTNPILLENEPIMRQLLTTHLGMTLIMIAPSMEFLPKECHLIFNLTAKPGMMHTAEGDSAQVDYEYPNRNLLTTFSRNIAPLRVKDAAENAAIPTLVSFLDIYNVRRTEDLDVWRMWSENHTYEGLRSIIGYAAGSHPFVLDISDKYHGPHGLIAGTTGSGKSVMLQTYILSLALNYSPEQVQFILIDYKGGGMADPFLDLPHTTGTIDNLQSSRTISRALASLNGELQRRQRIFKAYDVSNINDYTQMYGDEPNAVKLPHLIIIVDEFAELKSEQPEFMAELVSASRIGRSLGVHLILATQKPSNSVSDEIWANSRFHLCLRVQTRGDSMEMLKRPDAAYIKGMGRCFVQIGSDELFEQVQT
ncbi:MAG: FtsK/SpoIIIE domain-containing protein, partial [bacterium]